MNNKPDPQKYVQPALTTIESIIDSSDTHEIKAAFIGGQTKLLNTSEFSEVYEDYKNLKRNSAFYDKKIDFDRKMTTWNPNPKLLAIKYSDNRYQFSALKTVSNERYLAVQFLKKLIAQGIQVEGEYESLKDSPEQFSKKSWKWIYLAIFMGTFAVTIFAALQPL